MNKTVGKQPVKGNFQINANWAWAIHTFEIICQEHASMFVNANTPESNSKPAYLKDREREINEQRISPLEIYIENKRHHTAFV